MKVPQFSPYLDMTDYEAIKECFENNWITEGPKAKEFCEKLKDLVGSKYGVLAPNGTLALYLGLKAIGVGEKYKKVIVPDFTFMASATAIVMAGAEPVFVDIDDSLQIDVEKLPEAPEAEVIMPVHIYGMAANMDKVMSYAKKNNMKVIEDAAQALGVSWNGRFCGSFGDVGCISFFADKTITTGEGGFVATNDEEIYNKLLLLRNQGRINRGSFIHPEIGFNFRMTDIQCALGLSQLRKLEKIKQRKLEIFSLYEKQLKVLGDKVKLIRPQLGSGFIPFRVAILVEGGQEKLCDFLKTKDIEPRTFFYPLHKQPPFKEKNYNCIKSQEVYEQGICLPSFPSLENEQVTYVCDKIKEYYGV